VQNEFEHAVALLHSFWYAEAEKKFPAISSDDAQCAMAHWDIAMSLWHQLRDEPAAIILRRVSKSRQINRDQPDLDSSLPWPYP